MYFSGLLFIFTTIFFYLLLANKTLLFSPQNHFRFSVKSSCYFFFPHKITYEFGWLHTQVIFRVKKGEHLTLIHWYCFINGKIKIAERAFLQLQCMGIWGFLKKKKCNQLLFLTLFQWGKGEKQMIENLDLKKKQKTLD